MVAMNPSSPNPLHRVRLILEGGTVAVVGGERRQSHVLRITEAFGLDGLLWLPTRESDASPRRFASVIGRTDLVLVISLQGLLRHQHAHDLRDLCRRFGVPHLACWRSPHPTGVAAAIVAQHLIKDILARRGR